MKYSNDIVKIKFNFLANFLAATFEILSPQYKKDPEGFGSGIYQLSLFRSSSQVWTVSIWITHIRKRRTNNSEGEIQLLDTVKFSNAHFRFY